MSTDTINRFCEECDVSINNLRKSAKFCSANCRQKAFKKRRAPERLENLSAEIEIAQKKLARLRKAEGLYRSMGIRFLYRFAMFMAMLVLGSALFFEFYGDYRNERVREVNQKITREMEQKALRSAVRHLHGKMPEKSAKWLEKKYPSLIKKHNTP
ncbi:MAG: hypothetical protein MI749_18925 [Desulfovibrionales bacterium]|nr:hypothetical protein [Desulfovibrionales bacterium]